MKINANGGSVVVFGVEIVVNVSLDQGGFARGHLTDDNDFVQPRRMPERRDCLHFLDPMGAGAARRLCDAHCATADLPLNGRKIKDSRTMRGRIRQRFRPRQRS